MRTLIFVVLVIFSCMAAGLAIGLLRVSAGFAEHTVADLIHAWTGQRVCVGGETTISVLPFPTVMVEKVEGRDCAEDMSHFKIGSLQASVRVLPLLGGWVEAHSLTLRDAQIRTGWYPGDNGKQESLSDLIGQAQHALHSDARHGGLDEIILQNSTILFANERTGQTEEITDVNVRLALGASKPLFQLAGSLTWQQRRIDLSVDLDDPQDLSTVGSRGQLTIAVRPAAFSKNALGFLDLWSTSEGQEADSKKELKQVFPLFDPDQSLGPLHVAGVFKVAEGHSVALEEATIDLPGMSTSGDLALEWEAGMPRLTGSLEFEELDFVAFLKVLVPEKLSELLDLPAMPDEMRSIDVDLRARGPLTDSGPSDLAAADVRIRKRGERVTVALKEMGLAGGHAEGTLLVTPAVAGVSMHLAGQIEGVSASDVARAFWPRPISLPVGQDHPPEGLVTAAIDLSGQGETLGAIVASLEGWAVAMVRDGSVDGADIVPTLQRLATGTIDPGVGKPFIPIAGRTSFSTLIASANIRRGVVHVPAVRFEGDRFEINMSGRGKLANGEIEAEGIATLHADSAPRNPEAPLVELPFGIGGTMREPMFAPGIPQVGALPTSSPTMPADGADPIATLERARDVVRRAN